MRQLAWDLGTRFPPPFHGDVLAFASTHSRTGYLRWCIEASSVEALKARLRQDWSGEPQPRGDELHGAALVLRIYDVTDLEFDGLNAHGFFDIAVDGLAGHHWQSFGDTDRVRLAELGFLLPDGSFHALARSQPRVFDRAGPSGNFQLGGLYVAPGFERVFAVESVFDAPAYEKLARAGRALPTEDMRVAVACTGFGAGLRPALARLASRLGDLRVSVEAFGEEGPAEESASPLSTAERQTAICFDALARAHAKRPFQLVHCHDWYSAAVGLEAQRRLALPFVLSLHSTEHERSFGAMNDTSRAIADSERQAAQAADLVIVPHSSTRGQLIDIYGVAPDRVTIVSDHFQEPGSALADPGEAKKQLNIDPLAPVALFAGELSHATGADLLVEGMLGVAGRYANAHFLVVGEGPLKVELEGKAYGAGLWGRARFLGHVEGAHFQTLLMACDFVVMPARSWQDEGLAHQALALGKPVLATHQSGIRCVHHGDNGLMTYDNPGSIVWGMNEMLSNPLGGRMLRSVARRLAQQGQSLEGIAVEHLIAYGSVLAPAVDSVLPGSAPAASSPRAPRKPASSTRELATSDPLPPGSRARTDKETPRG